MIQESEQKEPRKPEEPTVSSSRWRLSLVWLVPIVAALIALSLLVHAWMSAGPQIIIHFERATGLEAGKTLVKYKDVAVGTVTGIALSEDHSHVIATVDLNKSVADFARSDTRFWVVRPRIGASGVSGIDTLLSGAYIGVDAGKSDEPCREFTGLETPPTVINGMSGKAFVLHTDDLGSLDIGSPVYFRRIQVGQVASYRLDDDGKGVTLQVFVSSPNDRFVSNSSRFWNASGLDLSFGADGIKLDTQSMATVIAGGIAFATPDDSAPMAEENSRFILAKDQQSAMAYQNETPEYVRMRFDQAMRGLNVNAPVEFRGTNIGRVTSVFVDYDPVKRRFPVVVDAVVYPQRLGHIHDKVAHKRGDKQRQPVLFVRDMVAQGLRAQARVGNLLTGQLYIAFDFIPNAPKAELDVNARPLIMPTVGGEMNKLQEQVASIIGKVDKIPFESISSRLDDDLSELNRTLKQVNEKVLPEAQGAMAEAKRTFRSASGTLSEDSQLQQNLNQTLQELQKSARSLRTLTDMLGRHPEVLIRGRAKSAPLPGSRDDTSVTPSPSETKEAKP